jgi:hypothetical protein
VLDVALSIDSRFLEIDSESTDVDVVPVEGTVEKVLIRVVWFWKAYGVRAGLDRDEVVVVTSRNHLRGHRVTLPASAWSRTRRNISGGSELLNSPEGRKPVSPFL